MANKTFATRVSSRETTPDKQAEARREQPRLQVTVAALGNAGNQHANF